MTGPIPCNKSTYLFTILSAVIAYYPSKNFRQKLYKAKTDRAFVMHFLMQHKPSRFLFYAILPLVIYYMLFISTYRPYQEQQEQPEQAL